MALLILISLALPARAQFSGYSIPQTIANTPFSATSCTGAQQTALIANMGQTEHFITVTTAGGVVGFRATVQGSHDSTTFNDISDVATTSGNTVEGQGYYPITRVSVTCAAAVGTFTVQYSGEATAPAPQFGGQASAQMDKTLAVGAAANATFTSQTVRAPYGTSGGALYFLYSGAGPAGSTLNVSCSTLGVATLSSIVSYPLPTTATVQLLAVPLLPCDFVTVTYTSGGASAQTFTLSYVFNGQTITGGDPCQGSTAAKSSVAINAAATTQLLVAAVTGHAVYACGFNFTLTSGAAAATATIQSGTGATCAGSTVNQTGAMTGIPTSTVNVPSGGGGYQLFKGASGSGACLVVAGAGSSAQGLFTFILQ